MYVYMYVGMYVYVCVCVGVCMYVFFIVAWSITRVILHAFWPYDTYIVVFTYTIFKISYTNYYILLV